MSDDDIPPDINAIVERLSDGFQIRLAPVGVAPLRAQVIIMTIALPFTIGAAAVGVWLVTRADNATGVVFLSVWTSLMSAMAAACLCGVVCLLHMIGGETEIVITEASLSVRQKSRWRKMVRQWRRNGVAAFDTDLGGLWVLNGERERPILPERTQSELRWLAETLAGRWRVPDREPLRDDEIKITVLTTDERGAPLKLDGVRKLSMENPLPGAAWLRHGQLGFRSAVYRRSPIRFVPRGQWFKNWWALFDGSHPLSAEDFNWTERDGQPCLQIAARIPQGDGFDLWIWPDDVDALRSMVTRFLGGVLKPPASGARSPQQLGRRGSGVGPVVGAKGRGGQAGFIR